MKHSRRTHPRAVSSAGTNIAGSQARKRASIIAVLLAATLLAVAVRAYSSRSPETADSPSNASATGTVFRNSSSQQTHQLQSRLSFQPVADKFRHLLGERFVAGGKERALLIGTLTVGNQQFQAAIARTQNDDGELVEIALNGGPVSTTWDAQRGALSAGAPSVGDQRAIIERLALDSPDEFVLAQLRSSYRMVGYNVVPKGVGEVENYFGPLWEVVQVTESVSSVAYHPLSSARLYYINALTGLLDQVVSLENGEAVSAEFSGWASQAGEKAPTRITWRRNDHLVMQLDVSGTSYGALP